MKERAGPKWHLALCAFCCTLFAYAGFRGLGLSSESVYVTVCGTPTLNSLYALGTISPPHRAQSLSTVERKSFDFTSSLDGQGHPGLISRLLSSGGINLVRE